MDKLDISSVLTEHALYRKSHGKLGRRAKLEGLDLSEQDLAGVDLSKARLRGSVFADADMSNANLYRADMRGTDLNDASLYRANLCNTDLRDSHLNWTFLGEADLRGADLRGADIRWCALPDHHKLINGRHVCWWGTQLAVEDVQYDFTVWRSMPAEMNAWWAVNRDTVMNLIAGEQ